MTPQCQPLVKMYNKAAVEFEELQAKRGDDPLDLCDLAAGYLERFHPCCDGRLHRNARGYFGDKNDVVRHRVESFIKAIDAEVGAEE